MSTYYGDIALDATLVMYFNTTNAEGAPIAPSAALVAGDFEFYSDGTLATITGTPIVYSTPQVGLHILTIDTSVDTDFATGTEWVVAVANGTPETIDGQVIDNMIVGSFSIENRSAGLRPTVAGRTLDVSATGEAGIDWANIGAPTTAVDLSATDIQLCDTTTTLTGHTAQTANHTANIAAILTDTGTTLDAALAVVDANVDSILVDTAEIGTAGAGLTNINLPNQTMDITGDITGNLSGTVGSVTGAVGSVAAGGIVANTFGAGAIDAAAVATDAVADQADASSQSVWNAVRANHQAQNSFGECYDSIQSGQAVAGTLSTTNMTCDIAETTDDHFIGRTIIWTSGALLRQATDITDSIGFSNTSTRLVFTATTEAPSATDQFLIV